MSLRNGGLGCLASGQNTPELLSMQGLCEPLWPGGHISFLLIVKLVGSRPSVRQETGTGHVYMFKGPQRGYRGETKGKSGAGVGDHASGQTLSHMGEL